MDINESDKSNNSNVMRTPSFDRISLGAKTGHNLRDRGAVLDQRGPSRWRTADALKIAYDVPGTTMPEIPYNFPVIDQENWQWDSWALRDIDGHTITYNGWYILFSLIANRQKTGGNTIEGWSRRNDFASIGYYYSRTGNGSDWKFGGHVIAKGANKRSWQWSGCAVMREGTADIVDLFYTSVNEDPPESVVAHTVGRLCCNEEHVWFQGFEKCEDLFAADGKHYATFRQNQFWDFRDPHVVRNPDDGQIYVLFEGNIAGKRGTILPTTLDMGPVPAGTVEPDSGRFSTAAIGIARLTSDASKGDFSKWELLPPLVTALGVNDQAERPHVVFKDDMTYLFTIAHDSFFSGVAKGPDGVYGFVSRDGLFGPYKPMNSSGLVLGNPTSAPKETYSHFIDTEGFVQSFIDIVPAKGSDPEQQGDYRIGGTLAPTVRLVLEGESSYLTETFDCGEISAVYEWTEVQNHNPA